MPIGHAAFTPRFFITSTGRTATKWLAWLMNHSDKAVVLHENDSSECLVSSSHIENMLSYMSAYERKYTKFGVIIRDPVEVLNSQANRIHAAVHEKCFIHGGDFYQALKDYVDYHIRVRYPMSTDVMDVMLHNGALPIDYRRFGDVEYVNRLVQRFGLDDLTVTEDMCANKLHKMKKVYDHYTDLDPRFQNVLDDHLQPFFDKWYPVAQSALVS